MNLFQKIALRLYPRLLHEANKEPHLFSKEEFYALKSCVLENLGRADWWDAQYLPGIKCRSCGGSGRHPKYSQSGKIYDYADCWHCTSGWYKMPKVVKLDRFHLGPYVFHQPDDAIYFFSKSDAEKSLLMRNSHERIEGWVTHGEPNRTLALLFYWVMAPSWTARRIAARYSGKSWYTSWSLRYPLRFINNILYLRRYTAHGVIESIITDLIGHCRMPYITYYGEKTSYTDPDLPF